ncbi:hypothetical protein I314_06211 [Cryptococcus bacillisporus CA1873]|uniref:Small nuclear ribonucleoprotein Prp3 C-terminal domain-containing protein n=1 Tax=Cryptococcus bacillisporus CA1873 TaxID=1296111 RepID=A0ABR5B3J1_CRYGA|nr:hypothetical protein I314_06211 [Cryptococcus bacillisporus CA1873]|eukprot:KIR57949.1 hypothetical protein I314_06211 [Cryptococcus gattii CA1873]
MYPSETTLPPSTAALVEAFELGEEDGIEAPESLEVELSIKIDEEKEEEIGVVISLRTIDVDLENHPPNTQVAGDVEPTPQIHIRPKQPTWLSNSSYTTLLSSLSPLSLEEEGSEYILTSIEHIRESLLPLLPKEGIEESDGQGKKQEVRKDEGPEQRVWFWFPMLSTKEKRNDIVQYADEIGLTGFVLAGKPALLCVEGPGLTVERYMSRIKSESWSDIPSYQKKVTERFRRPLIPPDHRAFTKMTEITHLIPKYGQYNHRGEMSEVRRLMEEWGVGEDFGAVVLNSGV